MVAVSSLRLRDQQGTLLPFDPSRWHASPSPAEEHLLRGLAGPVLDVGCGPGRAVDRLARHGIVALGVDPAPGAVAMARRRGCAVLQRSVFDPLPGEGRWGTVLLLDGNVGIGGDPVRLLSRCASLVRRDGSVVAEVEMPGTAWRNCRARLERVSSDSSAGEDGPEVSDWFGWSIVGADAVADLADAAGLAVRRVGTIDDGRWFAWLTAVGAAHGSATG